MHEILLCVACMTTSRTNGIRKSTWNTNILRFHIIIGLKQKLFRTEQVCNMILDTQCTFAYAYVYHLEIRSIIVMLKKRVTINNCSRISLPPADVYATKSSSTQIISVVGRFRYLLLFVRPKPLIMISENSTSSLFVVTIFWYFSSDTYFGVSVQICDSSFNNTWMHIADKNTSSEM